MNCKPGDLAYVIQTGVETPGLSGRLVVVEAPAPRSGCWVDGGYYAGDHAGWICSAAGGGTLPVVSYWGPYTREVSKRVIADQILRPIRDPGDDAKDETLSWLPVPSTEKEAV